MAREIVKRALNFRQLGWPIAIALGAGILPAAALEPHDLRYLQGTGQCVECHLQDAILVRAPLMGARLMGSDLSRSDLSRASLIAADLFGANLTEVTLVGANLVGADLSYAKLNEADLSGAILYDVIWNGTQTEGAFYTEETVFDPEVDPESLGMILLEE
ncbi:pentapeptide repeat-containing protein [Synechococcus sp. PCC 7336]|uniref:pentapeptide repeat-containing protein n=1 Tax=Synechococcus sp. PCC 7336 TaxID=195250 RepID=UPI000349D5BD|nr:pentapeptide repeat-containing protein [Synechococcus sp. PCC 7336]